MILYNQADNSVALCQGFTKIVACNRRLYETMTSSQTDEYQHVSEASGKAEAQGLFVFSAAESGYKQATETFIADESAKVWRQFTIVNYVAVGNSTVNITGPFQADRSAAARFLGQSTGVGAFQKTVNEHTEAFKTRDLEFAMAQYTENSAMTIYNQNDHSSLQCRGLVQIEACHKRLFESISTEQTNNYLMVEETLGEGRPAVALLVFLIPGSGYKSGSGTYIADDSNMIHRQRTVVNYVGTVNITAPAPWAPPVPVPTPASSKTPLYIGLVVAVVAVLAIGIAFFLLQQKRQASAIHEANLEALRSQGGNLELSGSHDEMG